MDKLRRLMGHVKGIEPEIAHLVEASDMRDVRATFYVALPFIAFAELINAVLLLTAWLITLRRLRRALAVRLPGPGGKKTGKKSKNVTKQKKLLQTDREILYN